MLAVPRSFLEMPRWRHDEPGRAWLAELPGLVARRCDQWQLDVDGEPLHGSNALVVPVRRGDEPAALRLAPPVDGVAGETGSVAPGAGRGFGQHLEVDGDTRRPLLNLVGPSHWLPSGAANDGVGVFGELARLLAVPAP